MGELGGRVGLGLETGSSSCAADVGVVVVVVVFGVSVGLREMKTMRSGAIPPSRLMGENAHGEWRRRRRRFRSQQRTCISRVARVAHVASGEFILAKITPADIDGDGVAERVSV